VAGLGTVGHPVLPALNLNLPAARGVLNTGLDVPTACAAGNEAGLGRGVRVAGEAREREGADGFMASYLRCEVKNLKIVSVGAHLRKRLEHSLVYFAENQVCGVVCCVCCVRERVCMCCECVFCVCVVCVVCVCVLHISTRLELCQLRIHIHAHTHAHTSIHTYICTRVHTCNRVYKYASS
jgi:hypothetical protein